MLLEAKGGNLKGNGLFSIDKRCFKTNPHKRGCTLLHNRKKCEEVVCSNSFKDFYHIKAR